MDADLLGEVLLRMDRAGKHLEDIEGEIKAFEAMKNHSVVVKLDRQRSCYFVEGRATRDTDPSWSPIISDIAHQLRSLLDNLVYAVSSPGVTNGDMAFPIVNVPSEIDGWKYKRAIDGIPPAYAALIEQLQPGAGGNLVMSDDALPALRVLSNRDKHRHGHATIVGIDRGKRWGIRAGNFSDCVPGEPKQLAKSGPIDHAKLVKIPVRITGPNPQVTVEEDIATCVAFGNRVATLKDAPVRNVLWTVGRVVAEIAHLFIAVKP